MFWYLVMVATGQFVGPLPQATCNMAAANLAASGIVCKASDYSVPCPAPGYPEGTFTACPHFTFPQVTPKKESQ